MFISNTEFMKKFVTIICSSVCIIFTAISILAFFLSSDKKPVYIFLASIIIIDVTWILVYIFYVSKK